MTNFVKVLSNAIEGAYRVIKFVRYGTTDIQTAVQAAPFGFDSSPYKDMIGIYSETNKKGKPVIIGYINRKHIAALGETRIYSVDSDKEVAAYILLKNDGNILLGGGGDNVVRFTPLKNGLDDLVSKINAELTKIQTGITGVGGTYTKLNVSVNINSSKVDNLKTP